MLPATQFIHDYMHCFFQKGVFNSLTYWFFESLEKDAGLDPFKVCAECFGQWELPGAHKIALDKLFRPGRKKNIQEGKSFTCTASEGLTLYPFIGYLVATVVMPSQVCLPQALCYLSMVTLLDMILAVQHGSTSPGALTKQAFHFFESLQHSWME